MDLSVLKLNQEAEVVSVDDGAEGDVLSRRLRELGFVPGEPVRLLAKAPFGGDPVLIHVGDTKFALRLNEAKRVRVRLSGDLS